MGISTKPSSRALELFQRTNQFNLSGSKYTMLQLSELLLDHHLFEYSVSDIHGDDGVVGVILSSMMASPAYPGYAFKLSLLIDILSLQC